jgi:hypothetical protein
MKMNGKIHEAMFVSSLFTKTRRPSVNSGGVRERGTKGIHFLPQKSEVRPRPVPVTASHRERTRPFALFCIIAMVAALVGCDLTPSKPEAVFILYRDRMKSDRVDEARKLLTEESRNLATAAAAKYKLKQEPENLALLNVLDPMSVPLVMKEEDTEALLQLRTLKGGLRLVRLVRHDRKSPWHVDILAELKAFVDFLEVRSALDMMREQAGEYAASWKSFDNQLRRMHVVEAPPPPPPAVATPPKPVRQNRRRPPRRHRP